MAIRPNRAPTKYFSRSHIPELPGRIRSTILQGTAIALQETACSSFKLINSFCVLDKEGLLEVMDNGAVLGQQRLLVPVLTQASILELVGEVYPSC
jgi:hypothetical protein